MTVYSCTPFFNELDVLEIRLGTLGDSVDVHVICEANRTFAGNRKPWLFDPREDRWAAWRDRIRLIRWDVDNDPPPSAPPFQVRIRDTDPVRWQRENHQRRKLGEGLYDLQDDDVVIVSDLDEIPLPRTIDLYRESADYGRLVCPALPMDVYTLNWRWPVTVPVILRLMPGSLALRYGLDVEALRQLPPDRIWQVSDWRLSLDPGFDLALYGYHLAYQGGAAMIRYKLREAAHPEMTARIENVDEAIFRAILEGRDLFGRGDRRAYMIPDALTPAYAREHRDRFQRMFIADARIGA